MKITMIYNKVKIFLWKCGFLGNKCPICNGKMIQLGHDRAFTRFNCVNFKCKFKN